MALDVVLRVRLHGEDRVELLLQLIVIRQQPVQQARQADGEILQLREDRVLRREGVREVVLRRVARLCERRQAVRERAVLGAVEVVEFKQWLHGPHRLSGDGAGVGDVPKLVHNVVPVFLQMAQAPDGARPRPVKRIRC